MLQTSGKIWLSRVGLIGVLLLAGCAEEPDEAGGAEGEGRILEPLPEPPRLEIEEEALPGAAGELAVVVARPLGDSPGNAGPTITFSKPMVALGSVADEAGLDAPATIEPPIPGTWHWLGSASAELVPDAPIPFSTRFRVTVPAGLRALDGSSLASSFEWEFQTPRPQVQEIEPADGDRWLQAETLFKILLNQPVQDIAKHIRLEVEGQGMVALRLLGEVELIEKTREDEEDRRYPRAARGELEAQSRQVRYELTNVGKLPLDRAITLVIDPALRGRDGPLELGEEKRFHFRTHGDMRVVDASPCLWEGDRCPWGPLILTTSNLADVESLRKRFSLEPAVEIDWDLVMARFPSRWENRRDPYVVIPGSFRPGTTYSLKIAAGAQDVFGGKAGAVAMEVAFDDRHPTLDVGNSLALLESEGEPSALPIQTVNLNEVRVELWNLSPSEMAVMLFDRGARKGMAQKTLSLDVSGAKNTARWTPVDVRSVFASGKRSGLFTATFRRPGEAEEYPPYVIGQVTDLAVHSKLGTTSGIAWVTSLSTGRSVPGARLSLYDAGGIRLWEGVTDQEGLAQVPGLGALRADAKPENSWKSRFAMIAAEKDGEIGVSATGWNDGLGPWAFDIQQEWYGNRANSLGMIFAERGIYRPGDTVHLKGLSRILKLGELQSPKAGSRVNLRIEDPRGQEILVRELATSAFGTFSTEVELGRDVPLGSFQVSAELDVDGQRLWLHGSFRVEEYRAPQFRVDVSTDRADSISGEPMVGRVLARYLFGAAMADASVRWSVVRTPGAFSPPGNQGFSFGVNTWWWDDDRPVHSREVIGSGEGITGAQGDLAIELGESFAPGEKVYDYTLEAEVQDVDRQRIAGRASYRVHPAAYYAGLRDPSTGFGKVGEPLQIELVAVDPAGVRVEGASIELEVRRREWKSIRKKGVGGQWFTVSEPVEEKVFECAVKTRREPVDCSFEPEAPGLYVYEAVLTDREGRRQVTRDSGYVIGSGFVSWQRNDTDRIDLVADRALYEPGQVAEILVKSPFPEAEALLTVEREGVILSRRVKLVGSANTLEVPIDESMIPNVFVSVLLTRGRVSEGGLESGDDPGRPAIRLGYAELKVERSSKRLQVKLRPDSVEKRPRQKVRVDVEVADHLGKGTKAEVAVWAVDEGVLRLTSYEIPDPIDAIHPPRGLSVQLGEPLIHLVQRQLYGEKGQTSGGGGGDGIGGGFRSDFRTTVLFAPEVITDEKGRAFVEFDLPDNLTTYRLMAMAVTEGDRMGKGSAEIQVTKPLLALPALPRLARVGDSFEAGVVIHATGVERQEVKVTAAAEGISIEGEKTVVRTIRRGSPEEVRFRFAATEAGEATLRFSVEGRSATAGGTERDGLEQKLPILLPVAMEAVATYGDTLDRKVEAIVPPSGIRPGIGGLELSLSSTILGGFEENMNQLVDYPYGCLEQQASRLVPFVAVRDLAGRYGIPWKGGETLRGWIGEEALASRGSTDPDVVIADTVRAIEELQNHDGGYRYWSSGSCSGHWASSYAVLSLGRAKQVGYAVDLQGLQRGQAYLAQEVAAGKCERCGWGCVGANDATRVFALYALARTGAPKPSYYGELFERRRSLPLFAQSMLADAIFVGDGDRDQARQLLEELLNHAKESAQEVHFQEVDPRSYAAEWSSDTRTTALVLQTLATISPDHPFVPKMSRYLQRIRGSDGRYRNTQEAAFALMALSEVSRNKEAALPSFDAAVELAGEEIFSARFEGRSTRVERATIGAGDLGKGGELAFAKKGGGVLYYGALLRYAPQELPTTALERGITVQRWFEPFAGGGQTRELLAGELVRVRVRIASAQERNFAVISVPIPAGLEIVDTSLATTAAQPRVQEEERPEGYDYESAENFEEEEGPWARRFFSPFNHSERRDDRLVLFADNLPPGVHVTSFIARATTPGDFVLQPAHAEEMYAPEVFGRSDGGRLRVIEQGPVAER